MMRIVEKLKKTDWAALVLLFLSILALIYANVVVGVPGDTAQAASRMERRIEKRMALLDSLFAQALVQSPSEWMSLDNVPGDIVIYRYVDERLQSWANSFIIANDDINGKMLVQRLTNPRNSPESPLSNVGEEVSYVNLGSQWYLLKSVSRGNVKLIGGLEIVDDNDFRRANNVNPKLELSAKFSVHPLSFSEGSPVSVGGKPQFKIIRESMNNSSIANVYGVWIALGLFIVAVLVFLSGRRSLRCFHLSIFALTLVLAWIYFWGNYNQDASRIFSPTLYAEGSLFYSLAAVIIINGWILLIVSCANMVRNRILWKAEHKRRPKMYAGFLLLAATLAIFLICLHTHISFSSIVRNSNINLELYNLHELSWFSLLVYFSYLMMLLSIPLLLNFVRPWIRMIFGKKFDASSALNRTVMACLTALYFVTAAAKLGFVKEDNKMDVWAGRLSMDRDIEAELQLRLMENSIANDAFIATLSALPNSSAIVQNRLIDNYMGNVALDYDVSTIIFDSKTSDLTLLAWFNDRIRGGIRINSNSRWYYSTGNNGHPRYSALFTYYVPNNEASHLVVEIEPKSSRDYSGYASILGLSTGGSKLTLPARYSYAKYKGSKLITFKGSYAYPTLLTEELLQNVSNEVELPFISDNYVHFPRNVDEDEYIVISRKRLPRSNYLVAFVFLALMSYIFQSSLLLTRRQKRIFESYYFRMRISLVLMISLVTTLVALTAVSVIFVYGRNKANRQEMMTDKINTLQSAMSGCCRYVNSYREIDAQELSSIMESASEMAKSDITLFTPYGKAFRSTAVNIYDRMLISDRMNEDAFADIVYNNKRFVVNHEKSRGIDYTMLYAPLFNEAGNMVAILSSPFSDDNYDFQNEAVMHLVSILAVFFILLLLARFMVASIVDRLFQPLVALGEKMNRTDIDNLEKIEYDRVDEVSTLVHAYNEMVEDLSESTVQLKKVERDKAWSSMARQVAHQIKNPLTPMKLQIQRLIRLKERNAPGWESKFDDAARIVLEHIDILSETATEFSMLAKLGTEDFTSIDLDALIQEELSMVDCNDSMIFNYFGLKDACVMGPKPQLKSALLNLLTNSVQAIEIQQQEDAEAGKDVRQGRVVVSLRNSIKSGYYDIVIEDNGPGVKAENLDKLFTPNFTTKSSGTGLGLAITRSVLAKCDAEISYAKSFVLGGASFTITYPKSNAPLKQ